MVEQEARRVAGACAPAVSTPGRADDSLPSRIPLTESS